MLDKWIEDINRLKHLIVVEGKKDKAALENIGIKNTIITLNKPLFQIVEEVAKDNTDVIILTDLDKEGKKIFEALSQGFHKFGVRMHNKPRDQLFKTSLRQIEGIDTYIKNQ